ncbi:MAG TPA: hypothetical protein VHL56_07420 [Candidatus Limnocylindrales bacterium]|jgi:hypothetical protein|nr:hypothetical protein [Candidatus Limnocylindrales bacterium]
MGLVMDLVAGDSREILLAVAMDDLASFDDPSRYAAHLTFGGAIDPTWLDLFSAAVRSVTGRDDPVDFLDARTELDGPGDGGERTVERIDPGWVTAIAMLGDRDLDAVTGHWIDLLEEELGELPREEKPSVRKFAREIVDFARAADRAPAVILAWSL